MADALQTGFDFGAKVSGALGKARRARDYGQAYQQDGWSGVANLSGSAGDLETAQAAQTNQINEQNAGFAKAKNNLAILSNFATSVMNLPYEQRKARIAQMSPQLARIGLDAAAVEGFDPTDDNLANIRAQAGQFSKYHDIKTAEDGAVLGYTPEGQVETLRPAPVKPAIDQTGYGVTVARDPMTGKELWRADKPENPHAGGQGGQVSPTGIPYQQITAEQKFADDWRGVYNNFSDIKNQYQRIQTMGARRDSAGDLALVVSFTKMLDPGSVAREGEVALTQSAASALAQAQNFLPRLQNGNTLLPDSVRNALIQSAKEMYGVYNNTYTNLAGGYADTAKSYGFDPKRAMIGYHETSATAAPPPSDTPPADPLGIRGGK